MSLCLTLGCAWCCFVQGVNRVTEDFSGAIFSLLSFAHFSIRGNDSFSESCRCVASSVMSGSVSAMVRSSAKAEFTAAGLGQSPEKKLYSVGERTAPCGTPLCIVRVFDRLVW